MGLFRTQKAFLQTNAWQNQNLNALRYNTSQAGSVVPWMDGTTRIQVNLIDFGNYRGPGGGGKKGKGPGPLPIGGTHSSGAKGGGGGKGKGGKGGGKKGKGAQDFTVDVDFGICTGPVTIAPQSFVWSSAGVAFFQSVQLNAYSGADGQAADPTMARLHAPPAIGYSGTCHITGTPMDLGMSPVIPNISFEPAGPNAGTGGPRDASPSKVVRRYLTDPRDGADFPLAWLDPDLDAVYGDYCLAAGLVISPALTGQTEAQEYLSGLAKLTNTAIVWSGNLLKMIPYGDKQLTGNGVVWTPDLVPKYSLTDDDFLPWQRAQLGQIEENQEDPILVTRSNPADAVNWLTIEYLDRANFYNVTVLPVFEQGAIDAYGRRSGDNLNGQCFCIADAAQAAARLHLQRLQYVRNVYKFQLGWQFALLEPMDIVLLTGRAGDLYLDIQPVRITEIVENENGDLTIEAEEIQVNLPTCAPAVAAPAPPPPVFQLGLASSFFRSPQTPSFQATATGSVTLPLVANGMTFTSLDVVVALIANQVIGGIPAGVIGVTDNLGLNWQRRATISGTTAPSGSQIAAEEWWADASSIPTGTTTYEVTPIFSGSVDVSLVMVHGFGGSGNHTAPWDSGGPAAIAGNAVSPVGATVSTSGPSVVLGWLITAEPVLTTVNAAQTINPWQSGGASIAQDFASGTHIIEGQLIIGDFPVAQSGVAPSWAPVNPSGASYLILTDALG